MSDASYIVTAAQPEPELLQALNPQSATQRNHLTPPPTVFSSVTFYTSAQGRPAAARERTPNDPQ